MDNEFIVEFLRINRENPENCSAFLDLGYEYMKEVAADKPIEVHTRFLNSILNRQGEKERWLVGLKINGFLAGFVHFKIDRDERIGWGYILEFYIGPTYRRKGQGKKLYDFAKQELQACGIKDVWMTADKVNGEPFWFSLGFRDTGETENEQKILVRTI